MKCTYKQLENAVTKYIDSQLIPQYPEKSIFRVAIAVGSALIIKNNKQKVLNVINVMGLIDDEGKIELDDLKKELLDKFGNDSYFYDNKTIGRMSFTKDDVDIIFGYITEE